MSNKGRLYKDLFLGILIFGTLSSMSSCRRFLEVDEPNSKISRELVFSSESNANSAVAGIYLNMYRGHFASGGVGSLSWLTGLSADEFHNNPFTDPALTQFERNNLRSDNSYVANIWTSAYQTIYQVNAVIYGLSLSTEISRLKTDQFNGEALFSRAFCYFYLVNIFGDVPLVLTTNSEISSKLGRSTTFEVYNQIEKDLLSAVDLLSKGYPTSERVRPNKSVAIALLSRMYLYRQNWQKAEEFATKIIDDVNQYKLQIDLSNVFLHNSNEAIWQIKPQDNASFTNEGYAFSKSQGPINNILSDTIVNSFESLDSRKTNWITSVSSNGKTIFLPYKYKLFSVTTTPTTEYSMVFRLAEQYLIRAEARAHLGNVSGSNSANSDIDAVRKRAGLPPATAINLEEAMILIEHERKVELFSEWSHRWLDLKRWNKTLVTLSNKSDLSANDLVYPIPQSEINRNSNLKPQNSGY